MASSFTVIGANTKVDFNYTAPTATIINVVGGAAEYLWDLGKGNHGTIEDPIVFSGLSNIQKLTIVDDYLKGVILDLANNQKSIKAQKLARDTEEANKYII